MNTDSDDTMPDIHWLEGILDYFNAPFPHEDDDPRKSSFAIGRQIIGLYLIEVLLKYAIHKSGRRFEPHHNLAQLFWQLPSTQRRAVERKYKEILNNKVPSAWDYEETVDKYLQYLGNNPITDTRYFWERPHTGQISIVFSPESLSRLIYALFIALHQYPEGGTLTRHFNTKFQSFVNSLPDEDRH